jgi:uncharacterized damage-inducible protein DinB
MNMENTIMESPETATAISTKALLDSWQGHRRVTRRMIAAFPEDKFFTYSIGGMRTFVELIREMLGMAVPTLEGIVTRKWGTTAELPPFSGNKKEDFLRYWDETTEQINALWKQISAERFQEKDIAFGQWEMTIYDLLLYVIDNEIHHRGQGYVYLRSLGVEPPAFWDRS